MSEQPSNEESKQDGSGLFNALDATCEGVNERMLRQELNPLRPLQIEVLALRGSEKRVLCYGH